MADKNPSQAATPQKLDIVDTQVHLGCVPSEALFAMNALGIQSLLSDEFWGWDSDEHPHPGYKLANGAFRPTMPLSEWAALTHPDRFAYLVRVDHRDPQLESVITLAKTSGSARALRFTVENKDVAEEFVAGKFAHAFQFASDAGLPVFIIPLALSDPSEPKRLSTAFRKYLISYPKCRIIVDHVGFSFSSEMFELLMALSEYPNCYIKWCHAPHMLRWAVADGAPRYPFAEAIAYLRRTIAAFGAERIMWASDYTAIFTGETWADALYYVRDSKELDETERAWIMAKTARTVLDWPLITAKPLNLRGHHG